MHGDLVAWVYMEGMMTTQWLGGDARGCGKCRVKLGGLMAL